MTVPRAGVMKLSLFVGSTNRTTCNYVVDNDTINDEFKTAKSDDEKEMEDDNTTTTTTYNTNTLDYSFPELKARVRSSNETLFQIQKAGVGTRYESLCVNPHTEFPKVQPLLIPDQILIIL